MPYADPEKQREAQARWYREKYRRDQEFQRAEADRKAQWLQTDEGKESNAKASARHRERARRPRRAVAGVRQHVPTAAEAEESRNPAKTAPAAKPSKLSKATKTPAKEQSGKLQQRPKAK